MATFGQELQKLVQFLGVSHAQMQMGHMRFEPNINVHITDGDGVVHKTAITEIKNLNSFSVLQRGDRLRGEAARSTEWVETGNLGFKIDLRLGRRRLETTWKQRDKEQAHDYRYFPDPDLVPVEVSDEWLTELKAQVGELPAARRHRYTAGLGLSVADAAALAGDRLTGDFYEAAVAAGGDGKRVATWSSTSWARWRTRPPGRSRNWASRRPASARWRSSSTAASWRRATRCRCSSRWRRPTSRPRPRRGGSA